MKQVAVLIITITYGCSIANTNRYNKKPVVKANSEQIDYRVGDDWYKGEWSIAPEVENDTLEIICFEAQESFEFKTDIDKIEFSIAPNTSESFYVLMNNKSYAHTIISGVSFKSQQLNFDSSAQISESITYQVEENEYLKSLKEKHPLPFIKEEMRDSDVVISVLNWTNKRWSHNGNNSPTKNDAITILNEASEGNQFPCFAYAIVLKDQLTAIGYNARTVYLKTKDANNRKSSPGHVVTEVYIKDIEKWVFLDAQFNIMPTLNGVPLNAVELQNAITNEFNKLEFKSLSSSVISKKNYASFVYDYLYYFDTSIDNGYDKEKRTIEGKSSIMLVPSGAANLVHIEFWNMNVNYCMYTNSLKEFYAKPK